MKEKGMKVVGQSRREFFAGASVVAGVAARGATRLAAISSPVLISEGDRQVRAWQPASGERT
jgi:hypothetical protein